MKLSHLTVIFIIIVIPVILLVSLYISTGLKTIKYQSLYDTGLLTATHDALYAFEINTINSTYSDNAETKRNILKSSVKAFEKSLSNTCGISSYNTDEIEEYIPALVFGMYDGFYMYAPSYNSKTGKYEHNLKNYVYYSELLNDGTSIIYSLDNYVTVSGEFGTGTKKEYQIKEGYLIDLNKLTVSDTSITYNNVKIDMRDTAAVNYYTQAKVFTEWFLNKAKMGDKADYLKISTTNDPEDENSAFVQHKRTIIKQKIESVLNSTITAYSERTWNQSYKMPKLSEEDWDKIYNNISMISFFQGKRIGFTKYNGYCVLNSTNSNEYVNPNLMYFIYGNTYHDIRCNHLREATQTMSGYKIGSFSKKKKEAVNQETGEVEENYAYEHNELACYDCINGQINYGDKGYTTVYNYVRDADTESNIKTSYFTSLARERNNQIKLLDTYTFTNTKEITVQMMFYQGLNPENISDEFKIALYENGVAMEEEMILNSSNCEHSSDETYDRIWTYIKEGLEEKEEYGIDNPPNVKDANGDDIKEKYGLELKLLKDEENKIFKIEIICLHKEYKYENRQHICKLCGYEGQEKHEYVDEGNIHVCMLCKKQHEEKWINDNPEYHACKSYDDGCDIKLREPHNMDSDGNCTVCGYHQHNYTDRGTIHVCVCGDSHSEEWETTADNKHKCKYCTLGHDPYKDGSWIAYSYDGHYCNKCDTFGESCDFSTGTCPKCGNTCPHSVYELFDYYWKWENGQRVCSKCGSTCINHNWRVWDTTYSICNNCGVKCYHSNSWYDYDDTYHKCSNCGASQQHFYNYSGYCSDCNHYESSKDENNNYICYNHNWGQYNRQYHKCAKCGKTEEHRWGGSSWQQFQLCIICGQERAN